MYFICTAVFFNFLCGIGCGTAQKGSFGMKQWLPSAGLALWLLLFILPGRVWAVTLKYEEQFVYQLRLFDGNGYPETFIPQSEDTIYLLADTNNVVSPRVTLVAYWPLSGKFVAAFKELNEYLEGSLEIFSGSKKIHEIGQVEYVFFYPKGITAGKGQLHVGKEAYALFKEHEATLNDFYNKMSEYSKQKLAYRTQLMAYVKQLEERKERGESINPQQVEEDTPREPIQPNRLPFDLTGMQSDHIINLAAGKYHIQFRAPDGTIVEGSEKKLVVFTRRRVGGVGYDIIPGNRWTKRESSNDTSQSIYGTGNNTIYLRAFMEDEYNDLYYKKLKDPQNSGNPQRWTWVHTIPLIDEVLNVQRNERTPERIKRTAYLVKQLPGARLGYEILPYTPEQFPDKQPAFEAFKVEFSANNHSGRQTIWLEGPEGRKLPKSVRKMIIVNKSGGNWLYLISTFPLIVGFLIFVRRRKTTA
jgi:hypothetical protein